MERRTVHFWRVTACWPGRSLWAVDAPPQTRDPGAYGATGFGQQPSPSFGHGHNGGYDQASHDQASYEQVGMTRQATDKERTGRRVTDRRPSTRPVSGSSRSTDSLATANLGTASPHTAMGRTDSGRACPPGPTWHRGAVAWVPVSSTSCRTWSGTPSSWPATCPSPPARSTPKPPAQRHQ